jgi:photosystem II stability/assembly factor-like uncharacterized protein
MLAPVLTMIAVCMAITVNAIETQPAHWEPCGWGGGGFYWACAFHPAKDGVIYLGGDVAGAYKTEDSGLHWRFINSGLVDYGVFGFAVDRQHPDTVYVGTPSGLCKSTDAGEHWQFLKATGTGALNITSEKGVSIRNIAVDPADGSVLYAGTPKGSIFRSRDGGESWTRVYQSAPGEGVSSESAVIRAGGGVSSVSAVDGKPGMVLAAGTMGVLLSQDAGETWRALKTPANATSVVAMPGNSGVIYASFGKEGVWKSADAGQTWTAARSGIDAKCVVRDVAVDPRNADRVFCIGAADWEGFFYWSSDGGQNWQRTETMKTDLDADPTLPDDYGGRAVGTCPISTPAGLAVNPRNPAELFIAGNWRPCYSADGGRTWEERDRGADITCVTDIRFAEGRTYVTAMDEGLLVSDDGGRAWRQLCPHKYDPALSGHQWRVLAWGKGDADRVVSTLSPWAGTANRVLISEDGGATFRSSMKGLLDYIPRVNCMWEQSYPRALAADPHNPQVLYLGMDGDPEPRPGRPGGGVFKSEDGGDTWRQLPNQPGSRRVFYGAAVDPTDSNRVFWGACGEGGGLYRSEDAGGTWQRVFSDETWLFNVAVSPSGVVYCPGSNLWRSTDHGETWTRITDFENPASIVGLEIDPRDENVIWLSKVPWDATPGAIYKTVDGGRTWKEITGDIPCNKPIVLRFNPATGELWAGGVGLFKAKQ